MGFLTSCLGGLGFVLIGAWEAFSSAYTHDNSPPPPSSPPLTSLSTKPQTTKISRFSLLLIALLSFFSIIVSSLSTIDASHSKDHVGTVLQLQSISIASLFLLYSLVQFLTHFTNLLPLPPSIPGLIVFFAFAEEFLLFYLQRKDSSGLENRYFDLLLVPIIICICATLLELYWPKSSFPRFGRGIGLIMQGTWFIQMGFSFYTNLMAHGCALHEKSNGNYTIKCKGHTEYHRSKAIATLQFNCHLAFLVVSLVGLYSVFVRKNGVSVDYLNYKPLSEELRQMDNQSQFTLDSDEDEEIRIEDNAGKQTAVMPVSGVNGFGAH